MGGGFWPLAWQPIAYRNCSGSGFLDSMVHRDVNGEGHLVHVGDVFRLDLLISDLVLAIGAKNGKLFFIFWQLLLDGSSCADGEIMPFYITKAPRRTSLKNIDLHVTCYCSCFELNRDCGDTSTCCSLFNNPLFSFVL